MPILNRISEWAKQAPERIAFKNREMILTYRELWEQSDALATWMLENCPGQSPVIVYGHKHSRMLVVFLACAKLSRAYIPVDISTPTGRFQSILDQIEAQLIFALHPLPVDLAYTGTLIDDFMLSAMLNTSLVQPIDERHWSAYEAAFYMMFTSGSTGEPKGVQISEANLSSFLTWMLSDFELPQGSVYLNQAPLSFDLSVMDVYTSLCSGGTIFSIDRELMANPEQLFTQLRNAGLNIWVSTPSFAEFCLMEPSFYGAEFASLHTFLFCGEPLSRSTAELLLNRFPQAHIYNLYGPTEATVAVTAVRLNSEILEQYEVLPVGTVKPDCHLHILDSNGEPLAPGHKGEIIITGPSVSSKGYFRNKSQTKAFFSFHGERAYRTGDIGYVADGMLFFTGRADYQIKLQGYRIELEDIEENLRKLPSVRQAVVVPKWKGDKCEYLAAFLVVASNPFSSFFELSLEIKKGLSQHLPGYMIPRKFIFKASLPMNVNGKINRKLLASEV